MRSLRVAAVVGVVACALLMGAGCSRKRFPDVKDQVSKALQQAGFNDLRVTEDQDKGVVTLNGKVRSEELKAKADEVAKAAAPNLIVANQLSIEPVDQERKARQIEGNVDDAIKDNLKAAITANHLDNQRIHYDVKNGVVTLTGTVKNMDARTAAEQVAASVPNVSQVVNKLDVKK